MTWYLSITAASEVFYINTDDKGRELLVFNLAAEKAPSTTFEEELLGLLEAAGVGQRGVNLFIAHKDAIPPGPGPYLSIRTTGGLGPRSTQNKKNAYRRPGAQVTARAEKYKDARAMADAAFEALTTVTNREVTA